jgi:hypothetical protein
MFAFVNQVTVPTTADDLPKAGLGFISISSNSAIHNCMGVVDGYHLEIITPTKKEVQSVKSYYLATTKLME